MHLNLPPEYSVRRLQPADLWTLFKLHFFSPGNPLWNHFGTLWIVVVTIVLLQMSQTMAILRTISPSQLEAINGSYYTLKTVTYGGLLAAYFIILFVAFAPIFFTLFPQFGQKPGQAIWVIEHHHTKMGQTVIGQIVLDQKPDYAILSWLYLARRYRRKKIGSLLLRYIASQQTQPLYIFPPAKIAAFFQRSGCRSVSADLLPTALQSFATGSVLVLRSDWIP
jgi:GNAT superfamily N-acetyltransferase